MKKTYTKNYEINYYEVDSNLKCRLSSIVEFIGDVGVQQSEEIGVGMDYCSKNNCAWVFYKDDIKIHRYPVFGEVISITTEPIGFKKFYGLRKYTIRDAKEIVIGEAYALFFLIDLNKRRPMRIQEKQYDAYGVSGDVKYDISLGKIEKLDEAEYSKSFNVRYGDIDSNRHVNNVRYIEWALEAVPLEVHDEYEIRSLKVIFEKECKYGDKITTSATVKNIDKDNIKSYHTIKNEDGEELTLFEAEWSKISK